MPAPLSIVIPTLNAAPQAARLLRDLYAGLEAGLIREVIVSDGGSTDDIAQLADAVGAMFITGAPSRGGQLRDGCARAKGEWLLVLHADSLLARDWTDAVTDHIRNHNDKVGYFRLQFDQTGIAAKAVAAWANLRARLFHLPYGDQGLLIRRDLYTQIDGYPDQPLMEDVAIARAASKHLRAMDCPITTSAARYQEDGWMRRGTRNLLTLLRYLGGAAPETLLRSYAPSRK